MTEERPTGVIGDFQRWFLTTVDSQGDVLLRYDDSWHVTAKGKDHGTDSCEIVGTGASISAAVAAVRAKCEEFLSSS